MSDSEPMARAGHAREGRAALRESLLVFGAAAALYGACAATTIPGGDSGELASVALRFGVAHPPGYPLWTLYASLFGALPFGAPCWKIALSSALAMGLAVGLLFDGLRRLGAPRSSALIGLLPFALAPTTLRLGGVPEVFALHLALVAALFALSARVLRRGTLSGGAALALGALFGLGLSNHHTTVFAAPLPLVALFALRGARLRIWLARLGSALGGLVLGLSPYGYLVLAGSSEGWPRWGRTETLEGLFAHITRADYGTFSLGLWATPESAPNHAVLHLARTLEGFGPVAIALALVGVFATLRARHRAHRFVGAACIATWVLSGPLFHALFNLPDTAAAREIAARFDAMPFSVLGVLATLGAVWLAARIPARPALRIGAWVALGLAAVAPGLLALPDAAPRRHVIEERFGRDLLAPIPERAVLLIDGDAELGVLTYLQEAEGLRRDVRLVHLGLLGHRWYVEALRMRAPELELPFTQGRARARELVESAHRRGVPVFGSLMVAARLATRWRLVPFGLGVRALGPGQAAPPPAELEAIQRRIADTAAARQWSSARPTAVEARMAAAYGEGWRQLAIAFDTRGEHGAAERARKAAELLPALVLGGTMEREVRLTP